VINLGWTGEEGKFNENIYLIDALLFNEPRSLSCYVIEGTKKKALIDASGIEYAEQLLKKLKAMNLKPDILILTHSHWDHACGTPIIRKEIPNIEVMASHIGIESLRNMSEFNEAFSNIATGLVPIENVTPLKEGDNIDLGGLKLKIFETPGHTDCSICILDQKNKMLFTGDSLGYSLTKRLLIPPIMPPEFSEEKLLSSFDKIQKIDYSSIALAHFGILTQGLANKFPQMAKSAYLQWRDFFLSTLKKNPSEKYFLSEFSKKMQEYGVNKQFADYFSERQGTWTFKVLKMVNSI
jgi:glyoxylase-like metal-dependent hydrolase (beta-lactamase superfamily II)